MKRLFLLIAALFATLGAMSRPADNLRKVPLADPFILLYDGVYYTYGTGAESGIEVWISRDMVSWERAEGGARDGLALHREEIWGDKWFWVPEVYRLKDKFYMYFSAEGHICVAVSDSPLGPWTKYDHNPLLQNPGDLVGVGHSAMFRDKAGNLKIVFHAHKSREAIHPREMYISDVRFRCRQGRCLMEIDPGYTTPVIAE